ncbi:hypothetical protein K9U39_01460 [Rhodoblastus acidophilus]|uniref:Uncharacterized protein n=1 Tax=Candidatus Rhodoblastus alkanivorans TaxID=2954117 RepID=A0ABS9Z403_9HYPH|nr:hypothetical protein [Candidatus Rhodoblastus alkanivorans]MCI4680710.1 hypothetical protein [Candidatus Rhodoblastus alkanivorans]MCI4682317.1 hypothetical protein [Candidatus Rhodoblastus alkanivorans]MDI4639619.1 hypothetical protein [Rhodoblastus acidophilus]
MPNPKLIDSPLSRVVEEDGERVEILIYRIEGAEWTLEIVAADGCSTVWEEPFESDGEALAEAVSAIQQEGIKSFLEGGVEKGALH